MIRGAVTNSINNYPARFFVLISYPIGTSVLSQSTVTVTGMLNILPHVALRYRTQMSQSTVTVTGMLKVQVMVRISGGKN